MNHKTYMPIRDNGYEPGWLDNRTKVKRIDPETGELYLARIEDPNGNILEDYAKEGDIMAKGIPANKPTIKELTQIWEESGHSINKVRAHYKTYWKTAKEWLIEAGLVSAGPVKKVDPNHILAQALVPNDEEFLKDKETNLPEVAKKSTVPIEKPSIEELKAFAKRENYLNLANKGKKEFHTSYDRMKRLLDEAGLLGKTEPEIETKKDTFINTLEESGVIGSGKTIEQAVINAFCDGPSGVLIPNQTPPANATPAELEELKISWMIDIANSGYAAREKIGIIQNIIDLPGVEV